MVTRSLLMLSCVLAVAACDEFEKRSIVQDLRVLAMSAEPPEIVFPIDLDTPPDFDDLVFPDVEVCVLVADPAASRAMEYTLGVCAPSQRRRCDDPTRAYALIARRVVEDPELASEPVEMCGTLSPGVEVFRVVEEILRDDDALSLLGGLTLFIELIVVPMGEPAERAEYAVKRLVLSPELPAGRVANNNPSLDAWLAEPDDTGTSTEMLTMPLGRCADVTPIEVPAGGTLNMIPEESPDAREDYVLPTFDGGVRMYTENLTYSWYATAGSWQREVSGGPKDIAGNEPPLTSEWRAPASIDADPLDVSLWVVQRDERGGLNWYESCVRVVSPSQGS